MNKNKGCLGHNAGKPKEHLLLSIDEGARTGLCKTCGTVTIFKAGKKPDGTQAWRCYTAVKKTAKPRTTNMQPQQHFLSDIDEAARTAICAKCGPVKIELRGSEWKGKKYWRCQVAMRTDPKLPARQRKARLKLYYGLTPEQYDAMALAQDGKCAICKKVVDGDHHERLHVDHDHTTGNVRGLLCRECNVMLGHSGDSIPTLQAAIAYLENHAT